MTDQPKNGNNQRRSRAVVNLLYGQLGFYGLLIVCFFLLPEGLGTNNGLSYYGVHMRTVLPYTLAFVAYGYFALRAVRLVSSATVPGRILITMIHMLVWVGPVILLTPYSWGGLFDFTHTLAGASMFILQLVFIAWIMAVFDHGWQNWVLLGVSIASGVAALVSLPDWWRLEVPGQLGFQLAFSLFLIRLASRLPAVQTDR